jgi:hypothetical protein
MSVISQGVLVNYPVYQAPDACALNPIPAEEDITPGRAIFIAATFSCGWWILQWFIYFQNTPLGFLVDWEGNKTVPIGWMWNMLSDRKQGWTAASYLSSLIVYFFGPVMEFIAWFFYLGGNTGLFGWWVKNVGWWFAVVGMMLPWIFATFQIAFPTTQGGLPSPATEFGKNAVMLIVVNVMFWLLNAALHIVMHDRLVCHINSKPSLIKKCPLKRRVGMSEADYQEACRKIFEAVISSTGADEGDAI